MKTKTVKKVARAHQSISRLVFGLITSKRLLNGHGKDAAEILIPAVKKLNPDSKFSQTHVSWYLTRCKLQHELGLPIDRIVQIPVDKMKAHKLARAKQIAAKKTVIKEIKAKLKTAKKTEKKAKAKKVVEVDETE